MDATTTDNKASVSPPTASMSIDEFCARYGIARAYYFAMRKLGEGPAEVRIGERKVRISVAAAAEWERSHTQQTTKPPAEPAPTPPAKQGRTKKKPDA